MVNMIMREFSDVLPEGVKTYLKRIELSTERMYAMIDGVLHYSKLNSHNELPQKVDLGEVIDKIETDLEVLIKLKDSVIIRNELPCLDASPILIYQLFYNLILNSLKFAKAAVPCQITISSSTYEENGLPYNKITISDNGIGFDQLHAEKIFNTFIRLNPADQYEGSGLGLALCKKIVERYGGTILAAGTVNEGAEFTILFPRHTTPN